MNGISRIAPITDTEAARLVSAGTRADLAGQIMSTSRTAAPGAPPAAAAVAALLATSLASPARSSAR